MGLVPRPADAEGGVSRHGLLLQNFQFREPGRHLPVKCVNPGHGKLERIARTGETVLRAGAGTGLACLASFALRSSGLRGLANLRAGPPMRKVV